MKAKMLRVIVSVVSLISLVMRPTAAQDYLEGSEDPQISQIWGVLYEDYNGDGMYTPDQNPDEVVSDQLWVDLYRLDGGGIWVYVRSGHNENAFPGNDQFNDYWMGTEENKVYRIVMINVAYHLLCISDPFIATDSLREINTSCFPVRRLFASSIMG